MAQTGYVLEQTGEQVQNILNTATPQTSLDAEVERAQQAEGTLQQNIDGEATTRQQQDAALLLLIQQVQAALMNYYLKTETYSAAQIDQMLAAIKQFRYLVVEELPTPSADTMGIIYLVPSAHAVSSNVKDEYITLSKNEGGETIYYFEQIGDTAVDMSNYPTLAQMNAAIASALSAYYTKSEMNILLTGKQDVISDLSTIRSGAAAGATAYQKPSGGIPSTDLTAELQAQIASFITASVNNLVNYYLKSDTYTKAEVQQLVDAVKQFTYVSVAELPTASADTMNKIYLVPSTNPQQQNVKDEFITISMTDQGTTTYSWEQIGTTTIDLSGYYTSLQTDAAITAALNTALANYSTTLQMNSAIAAAIANYYTKTEVDTLLNGKQNTISDLSTIRSGAAAGATAYQKPGTGIPSTDLTSELQAQIASFITASVNNLVNYYLKSDTYTKAEVQQLVDAVKQFTYVSVSTLPTASADTMNKIYLVPSSSPQTQNVKDEYITISVTDQGTTTYSWEQIGSTEVTLTNYYTKTETDTAISNALNTALASYMTSSQVTQAITLALDNVYTKSADDAAPLNANRQKTVINTLTAKTDSTGFAATDLIQLYANDGTPNGKISRADLMGVVKDLLPSLLSSQSNTTDFLGLNSNGLGKTSLATAALLLGVPLYVIGNRIQCQSSSVDNIRAALLSYYNSITPSQVTYLCATSFVGGGTGIAIISPNGYSYFAVIILDYYNGFKRWKYSNGTWSDA